MQLPKMSNGRSRWLHILWIRHHFPLHCIFIRVDCVAYINTLKCFQVSMRFWCQNVVAVIHRSNRKTGSSAGFHIKFVPRSLYGRNKWSNKSQIETALSFVIYRAQETNNIGIVSYTLIIQTYINTSAHALLYNSSLHILPTMSTHFQNE